MQHGQVYFEALFVMLLTCMCLLLYAHFVMFSILLQVHSNEPIFVGARV